MYTVINIEGMSCEHCVKHVKEALQALPGVAGVRVSLEEKTATIEHEQNLALATMQAAVQEAGYEVAM